MKKLLSITLVMVVFLLSMTLVSGAPVSGLERVVTTNSNGIVALEYKLYGPFTATSLINVDIKQYYVANGVADICDKEGNAITFAALGEQSWNVNYMTLPTLHSSVALTAAYRYHTNVALNYFSVAYGTVTPAAYITPPEEGKSLTLLTVYFKLKDGKVAADLALTSSANTAIAITMLDGSKSFSLTANPNKFEIKYEVAAIDNLGIGDDTDLADLGFGDEFAGYVANNDIDSPLVVGAGTDTITMAGNAQIVDEFGIIFGGQKLPAMADGMATTLKGGKYAIVLQGFESAGLAAGKYMVQTYHTVGAVTETPDTFYVVKN